jgi:hypothetical protein
MTVQSKTQYEIKVYKIWYEDAPEEFYIGSTKHDALSKRMSVHRKNVKTGGKSKLYQLIRSKGGGFLYSQIALCMVSCKDEQRAFEQHWIDKLNPTLNSNRAYGVDIERCKQMKKEYEQRPERKQKKKERMKEYNQRPEIKQYRKEHMKEYNQRPEIKQMKKEYKQRPENKQKQKEYRQRPEIKQKQKEYRDSKKRTCVCGCEYIANQSYAQIHYNSKWHQEFIAGLPFPFNGGK